MDKIHTSARYLVLAGVIFFWLAVFVSAAFTPGYSHFNQAVSELGATNSPYPWIVNWVGIVPFALALLATGYIVARDLHPGFIKWISGILILLGALGFMLAGAMQCDVGCRQSEQLSGQLHALGAGIGFQLIPLAAMLLGLRTFTRNTERGVYLFSLLMCLGMFGSIALFLGVLDVNRDLAGLWQRVILLFISLWAIGLSVLLRKKDKVKMPV
ncbi:DUF998 domain-containing protein [Alteromonas ponticola]|uniref:DUF998 domain-containing protein n=1 Tax=Alteromonas ponticola TaxID=2720613 RepID=A0ABX1R3Q2_9ALTE|nr:DUF998 domain-containing protein [Alteromonas ponticola]NMH61069.1 DUF998 domain-containing protein [Alteromonas ponticola]